MRIDLLSLYVNDQCNLDCLYCYKQEANKLKKDLLTFEEQKKVIKEAKSLGASSVLIAGKEPLVYSKIISLISYIRSLNLNIILFTNGVNINEENAKFLYDSKVQIHFKLDSLNQKVYDTIANKIPSHKWVEHEYNNGKKTVKKKIPLALKLAINQGFNNSVSFPSIVIEVCVNKLNYKTIPELAEFCKSNKLNIRIERLITCGNALDYLNKLYLDEEKSRDLFSKLRSILGDKFTRSHETGRCLLRYNPVVFEDGSLGFCLVEKLLMDYGNIRNTSLKELFKRVNKVTDKLSENVRGNFKICPGRASRLKMLDKENTGLISD